VSSPKQAIRSQFRTRLEGFSEEDFRSWNQQLAPRLLSVCRLIPPQSYVAAYRARPREASLLPLFGLPFRFCFPRTLSGEGAMELRWVRLAKEDGEFATGRFGILEPRPEHPLVGQGELAAIFLPLLAFDSRGTRLGQGKGYYDRYLAGYQGLKIGVGFECQLSREELVAESHDKRLDLAVTEAAVRDFRAGAK